MTVAKRPVGRPQREYDPQVGDAICRDIIIGRSLQDICGDDGMPSRSTALKWLMDNAEFANKYARARVGRATARGDRIDGYVQGLLAGEIDHNQARVAIDAEKWQMSKEDPKRYGDTLKISGDEDSPLAVVVSAGRTLDDKLKRFTPARAIEAPGEPD